MTAQAGAGRAPEIQRLLDQALVNQESGWNRGERVPVEDLLARTPALREDAEAILDLIYREYLLRRGLGENPDPEEFYARFPDRSGSLMLQFGIDAAIAPSTELQAGHDTLGRNAYRSIESLDGYKIISVLGSGGMGVVYKALDVKLNRIVAIKTIPEGQFTTPDHLDRFQSEARAIARLRHPNIIAVHAIGEHENRPYLSLEFADAGSLAQRLVEKPMAPREAATLVDIVARAVHAAHAAGVIHRDLKPSNVLLTAEDVPKVSDFGLAKLLDSDSGRTLSGQVIGTPSYMGPEQAEGHAKRVGPAADIYALGAILYHALTGRPPFLGDSQLETLKLVSTAEAVPPRQLRPDVPRDLETICLKCLEKAPGKRYGTALDLAEDLRRFQQDEPIVARRIGALQRSWKWAARHLWQSISATTVVVAAAAFIGLTYRHNLQLRVEIRRTEDMAAESRRNYQEARSTIQAMLARANDQRVAGSPKLIDLRHDLQEDARGFYDRILAKIDTNDPVIKADTANAFAEASLLEIQLGHPEQAEKLIRRALELIQSTRADRPDEFEYLGIQVICLLRLTNLLIALGRADQALEAAKETVQKAELLAKATPDNLSRRELFATCLEIQGNTLYTLRRHADARVPYRKAIEIRENIDPDKLPGVTSRLAGSLMNEAVMFCNEQQIKVAEGLFGQAEKVLLAISPDERAATENLVSRLSQLYMNWGGMLCNAKRFDEALARIDDGLRRIEPYLRTEPNDAGARQTCLELHGNRGLALSGLGKHRESADEWKRVLELSREPVPPGYRIQWALELLNAGQLGQALKEAQLVQPAPGISDGDRYNLGCLFSLAAAAARRDASSSPGKGEIVVESHILESLRWLKSASEAGFFRDPANRDHAKNDTDLEILRDRPEFRQLIEPPAAEPTNKAK